MIRIMSWNPSRERSISVHDIGRKGATPKRQPSSGDGKQVGSGKHHSPGGVSRRITERGQRIIRGWAANVASSPASADKTTEQYSKS